MGEDVLSGKKIGYKEVLRYIGDIGDGWGLPSLNELGYIQRLAGISIRTYGATVFNFKWDFYAWYWTASRPPNTDMLVYVRNFYKGGIIISRVEESACRARLIRDI